MVARPSPSVGRSAGADSPSCSVHCGQRSRDQLVQSDLGLVVRAIHEPFSSGDCLSRPHIGRPVTRRGHVAVGCGRPEGWQISGSGSSFPSTRRSRTYCRAIDQRDYVGRLLEAYRVTPGTSGAVRRQDRVLAVQLHQRGVPLEAVENALVLAAIRRMIRPARGSPGHDPFAGLLLTSDRRSPANASQHGILSLPPPQTPTCRPGTIDPLSAPIPRMNALSPATRLRRG